MNFLKGLWTDPTTRATILRFVVFMLGTFIHNGNITLPAWIYQLTNSPDLMTMGAALLIPAGQKNGKP